MPVWPVTCFSGWASGPAGREDSARFVVEHKQSRLSGFAFAGAGWRGRGRGNIIARAGGGTWLTWQAVEEAVLWRC